MLSDLMLKKQLEFWKSFVRLGGEQSLLSRKHLEPLFANLPQYGSGLWIAPWLIPRTAACSGYA